MSMKRAKTVASYFAIAYISAILIQMFPRVISKEQFTTVQHILSTNGHYFLPILIVSLLLIIAVNHVFGKDKLRYLLFYTVATSLILLNFTFVTGEGVWFPLHDSDCHSIMLSAPIFPNSLYDTQEYSAACGAIESIQSYPLENLKGLGFFSITRFPIILGLSAFMYITATGFRKVRKLIMSKLVRWLGQNNS